MYFPLSLDEVVYNSRAHSAAAVGVPFMFSLWRVKAGFHTLPQVSVGAAVGTVDAVLWYRFCQKHFSSQARVTLYRWFAAESRGGLWGGHLSEPRWLQMAPESRHLFLLRTQTQTVAGETRDC